MSILRECSFYRDSEILSMSRGIGYCDLDRDRTTCNGNIQSCEKPDALRECLLRQKKGEKVKLGGKEGMVFFQKP